MALQDLLAQIDSLKARLDAMRPLDREREARVMQKFRLWWTYHSNAIEGNSLTQGETVMFLMEGLTAKGKPLKDHLDLRGHSEAINFLLDMVKNKEPMTEAAIRELHKILLVEPYQVPAVTPEGQPTQKTIAVGQYKTSPNHVRTPTGETHYYATPEETPIKMGELMAWYREIKEKGEMHPVELAGRYHHKFTAIHPFDDGNGRMSRLLMNLMLMQAGYPPAVIRIGERDAYLAGLRRADAGEYEDFLEFIAEHVEASLGLFIRAAEGEDVKEPTDLEKEIALLKMSLARLDEPTKLTAEIQRRLIRDGFFPFISEIVRLMRGFSEIFLENRVVWNFWGGQGNVHNAEHNLSDPMPKLETFAPQVGIPIFTSPTLVEKIAVRFLLNEFKPAASDHFSLTGALDITFGKLGFRLSSYTPRFEVAHDYHEGLTEDEIGNSSQLFVKHFVEQIKSRTGMNV